MSAGNARGFSAARPRSGSPRFIIWTVGAATNSRSGRGSELEATANLRRHLPAFFEQFETGSILDAPCGDFNWMQYVVRGSGLRYVGGDVVRPLIEENARGATLRRTSRSSISTSSGTRCPRPTRTICRDCLFHLSTPTSRHFSPISRGRRSRSAHHQPPRRRHRQQRHRDRQLPADRSVCRAVRSAEGAALPGRGLYPVPPAARDAARDARAGARRAPSSAAGGLNDYLTALLRIRPQCAIFR